MRLRPNHLCQALRPRSEHFLMALVTARPSSRVPAETTWSGCAGCRREPRTGIPRRRRRFDRRTGVEMVGREQGVPQAFEAAGGGGKAGVPKEVDHLTVNAKAPLGRGGEAAHDGSDRFFKKIGVRLAVHHKLRQSFAGVAEDHAPIPHKLPDIESLFRKFSRECPPMRRCGADDSCFAARECIAKVCAYRAGEDFVIFVKLDEMPVRGHTHIP